MLVVISPAKKLDFSPQTRYTTSWSTPVFEAETRALVAQLSGSQPADIGTLMHLSPALAQLNYDRYQQFQWPFTPENARQALLTFNGDVYQRFTLDTWTEADFAHAQAHLCILSGLYGVLRPLDLMQAYRLEMGTPLRTDRGKDLYAFWGNKITGYLNTQLESLAAPALINLASNEYFSSVQPKQLVRPVITPVFKEHRNGRYQSIFLYAKQARGEMADYIIRNRILEPENLKMFDGMGYQFHESLSSAQEWVFTR